MWNLAREQILREREELSKEECDAVREYKAMHEENFWSRWLREDERGKGERLAKAEKKEKEMGQKGGREKRRKKRTKLGRSKEVVRVVYLWRLLKSSVKGDTWKVLVTFRGRIPWSSLMTCLIVSLFLVSSLCSDREFVEPQSFSFSKKRAPCHTSAQEEMR